MEMVRVRFCESGSEKPPSDTFPNFKFKFKLKFLLVAVVEVVAVVGNVDNVENLFLTLRYLIFPSADFVDVGVDRRWILCG